MVPCPGFAESCARPTGTEPTWRDAHPIKPCTDFCAMSRETRRFASIFNVLWRIRASTNCSTKTLLAYSYGWQEEELPTWLAWGAATKSTGPCRGTFQAPRGCTSRKNKSASTDMIHKNPSYFQLLMG